MKRARITGEKSELCSKVMFANCRRRKFSWITSSSSSNATETQRTGPERILNRESEDKETDRENQEGHVVMCLFYLAHHPLDYGIRSPSNVMLLRSAMSCEHAERGSCKVRWVDELAYFAGSAALSGHWCLCRICSRMASHDAL